jgi:phage baseplate assembly protein V
MSQRAALAMLDLTTPRTGLITSYDPKKHAVKVAIQPEGVEVAGWIPLGAIGVGNGFGIVCGPNLGDMVQVAFDNASPNAPRIVGRFFSNVNMPPAVPSGDTYIVHQSGSALKFNGDGTITVTATSSITYTATQHHFVGPVQMDNTLLVKQTMTGQGGMAVSGDNGTGATSTITGNLATTGSITNNGKSIGSTHTHSGVQSGSSNTGTPV